MKRLCVWWDGRRVGDLIQDDHGNMRFEYGEEWLADAVAPPLSASLPKATARFARRQCQPFFGGLLPEDGQRTAVARALGVSADNDFSLLEKLGGEVAGAIQLIPPGVVPGPSGGPWSPSFLSDEALFRIIEELPQRPFLAGRGGLRLSLAGVQTKLPVVVAGARIGLPDVGQPTTHILKPSIPAFPGSTENEAFSMRLALAAGLDVAAVEARILDLGGGKRRACLLVDRYDRAWGPSGVRRIHQEDFCQASGITSAFKYQADGGPGFKACFDLLRRVATVPANDIGKLLRAVVFNVILGNADAHAKNFSLIYEQGSTRLAPLYDLLSTAYYPDLAPSFAMKIGDASTLEELGPRAWREFAEKVGIGLPIVRLRVGELADAVPAAIPGVVDALVGVGLDEAVLGRLAVLVRERAERCRSLA
jgi:serine/threonine-protein kinase HipA